MANTELQFEMAMRDQIIQNQREAQRNLWNLIMGIGLEKRQIMDLAAQQGITIEDWAMAQYLGHMDKEQAPETVSGEKTNIQFGPCISRCHSRSSYFFQNSPPLGFRSVSQGLWNVSPTICRKEHDRSPLSSIQPTKSSGKWVGGNRLSLRGYSNKCMGDVNEPSDADAIIIL